MVVDGLKCRWLKAMGYCSWFYDDCRNVPVYCCRIKNGSGYTPE